MRFFIVDAFTDSVFGGNPAGVVLLDPGCDFPDPAVMLKTAAELRYSETAFIKPADSGGRLHLRYFTPAAEVDFCGHATIASFTALLKSGLAEKNSSYPIHTLSGDLTIYTPDSVLMEMPTSKLVKRITEKDEIDELYASLGIERAPVTANGRELLPILIFTGFPDIIMPVENRAALAKIDPDFKYLSALSEKHGAGGAHVFTLDAPEGLTACCRNFAPLYDIDEEAATGTASGGLTYYLHIHGLAPAGYDCCFLQGEAMGRPSKIVTSIDGEADVPVIKVGGDGAVLAEGEIFI